MPRYTGMKIGADARFALEPLRIYFLIYPYDGFYVQEVASCFQMFLETILIPQKPIAR